MNLKKVLRINCWLACICLMLVLLGRVMESIPVVLIGIGAAFAALFLSVKYWRCPYCGGTWAVTWQSIAVIAVGNRRI